MRILGISGSSRKDSLNTMLLWAAAQLLPPGAELDVWEGVRDLPVYDEDEEHAGRPAAVQALWDDVAAADAVLIATPEYNHSVPGGLKNALDWLSRPLAESPLRGKPALVIGASPGMFGAVWAQAEVRKVLGALGADVVDEELPVAQADTRFDADGRLTDEETRQRLRELAARLARPATAAA